MLVNILMAQFLDGGNMGKGKMGSSSQQDIFKSSMVNLGEYQRKVLDAESLSLSHNVLSLHYREVYLVQGNRFNERIQRM